MSINREVAEAIGWKWLYLQIDIDRHIRRLKPPEKWEFDNQEWDGKAECEICNYGLPPYDTDLNAAMEAMSKLCRDSKDKILECGLEYEMTGDGWRYFAYIREAGIGINDFYAEGDTPALAVCHAILEAKGKR